MVPLVASATPALRFSRRSRRAAAGFDDAGRHRLREGENAAVRQQERISDHPQHAGRQFAGTHHGSRARNRRRRAHRAGGDGLPDLCRRRVAVQFQRPRAPLFHAARRERGGHSNQSCCRKANARRRATTSPSACVRASPPSPRNSARAWPWPKFRPARRCCRRSWPKFTDRPNRAGSRWRGRSLIFSTTRPAWWTPTGISKPTSRRCAS